jgi:prepilin-type N-terminal cleavage/methylation domain-containing protein
MSKRSLAIVTVDHPRRTTVEAAVPAAILQGTQATRLPLQHHARGFTLAELLVSVFVLVIILLIVAQLMNSATAITRTGNKHIDTDTQARVVLDRMALDFAQMVKRTDVDYYVKQRTGYNGHGNGHGWGQGHNGDKGSDQIAFFSQVPGYYPSGAQSPISIVAYRVNESNSSNVAYGKLERMAKGLRSNGSDPGSGSNQVYPIVFAPGQVTANPNPTGPWGGPWSAAINNDNGAASRDSDYEVIGPGVFRFEYYYLLKNGRITDWPWDARDPQFQDPDQLTISNPRQIGLSQVEAIAVSIAVIDPAGRALIQAASASGGGYGDILDVAADMADFKNARGRGVGGQRIGDLEAQWKGVVETTAQTGQTPSHKLIPPEAAKTIRIYTRYFDLKSL